MTGEQLEQAKKRADELLKYNRATDGMREFIEHIEEQKYVRLQGMNGNEMWYDGGRVFELIGLEVIDLLKKKLWEREDYLEKLNAEDLLVNIESTLRPEQIKE